MLEIVFLCTPNMLNFKRLALREMRCKTMKQNVFDLRPTIHHSCAIILVFDQYLHLTEYILVL